MRCFEIDSSFLATTEKLYDKLNKYLSSFTNGKISFEDMKKKTDRHWWLSPEEAVEVGFIDKVIKKLNEF